jgi:hypothetical protein
LFCNLFCCFPAQKHGAFCVFYFFRSFFFIFAKQARSSVPVAVAAGSNSLTDALRDVEARRPLPIKYVSLFFFFSFFFPFSSSSRTAPMDRGEALSAPADSPLRHARSPSPRDERALLSPKRGSEGTEAMSQAPLPPSRGEKKGLLSPKRGSEGTARGDPAPAPRSRPLLSRTETSALRREEEEEEEVPSSPLVPSRPADVLSSPLVHPRAVEVLLPSPSVLRRTASASVAGVARAGEKNKT